MPTSLAFYRDEEPVPPIAARDRRIPPEAAPILERLEMTPASWLENLKRFPQRFRTAVGSTANLRDFAQRMGQRWLQRASAAEGAAP